MVFLLFLFGVVIGVVLYYLYINSKTASGEFVVNLGDPMEETFKINMDDNLNDVCSKKRIVLDVKIYGDDSLN